MELTVLMLLLFAGAAASSIGISLADEGLDAEEDPSNPGDPSDPSDAAELITGTDGDDMIVGTVGLDNILGLAGNDTIDGLAGNDAIDGGADDDMVFGGKGDDHITLGAGTSQIAFGGSGADTLIGGDDGHNILVGGGFETSDQMATYGDLFGYQWLDKHSDVLVGGKSTDTLVFSAGDTATGGDDTDDFYVHDIGKILLTGKPAVITDLEEDEILHMHQPSAVPTWETDGDDVVILVEGKPVVIVENAAEYFSDDNLQKIETDTWSV